MIITFLWGCASHPPSPYLTTPKQNEQALSDLVRVMETKYSYYGEKKMNIRALLAPHRESLMGESKLLVFNEKLSRVLEKYQDVHIHTEVLGREVSSFRRNPPLNFNSAFVESSLENIRRINKLVTMGDLPYQGKRILYMNIPAWAPDMNLMVIETLISMFESYEGLILDVRNNGGGSEDLAGAFAAHFMEKAEIYAYHLSVPKLELLPENFIPRVLVPKTPLVKIPTVVLMGEGCMSSNESFLLMMRQAGIPLIGRTSGGSTGNPRPYVLANGITLFVPSWIAFDGDKQPLEGKGIDPDFFVEFDESQFEKTDTILLFAQQYLNNKASKRS